MNDWRSKEIGRQGKGLGCLAVLLVVALMLAPGWLPAGVAYASKPPTNTSQPTNTPKPEHKIDICHLPPGNPENAQDLSIDESAWQTDGSGPGGHGPGLHGGDYLGNCVIVESTPTPEPTDIHNDCEEEENCETPEPTQAPTDEPTEEPTVIPTQPAPTEEPTTPRFCWVRIIGYLFHLVGPQGQQADFASFSEREDGTWYIPNAGSQQRCLGWIAVNAPWGREVTVDCDGNVSVKLTKCSGGGCAKVYKDD